MSDLKIDYIVLSIVAFGLLVITFVDYFNYKELEDENSQLREIINNSQVEYMQFLIVGNNFSLYKNGEKIFSSLENKDSSFVQFYLQCRGGFVDVE